MVDPKRLGVEGEDLAVRHLEQHRYAILDRNVRLPSGEIDILARQDGDLVFVEVKTRSGEGFGSPAEAVTPAKARQIARCARDYVTAHRLEAVPVRCDVVTVILAPPAPPCIDLIRGAVALAEHLPPGAAP